MLKTKKFEVLDYLKTEKDIEDYLAAALEEKDFKFLLVVLADIARARKTMASAAQTTGVSRTTLYQSLSADGRLAFETVAKVADFLGYISRIQDKIGSKIRDNLAASRCARGWSRFREAKSPLARRPRKGLEGCGAATPQGWSYFVSAMRTQNTARPCILAGPER
jgi:probable addiction module antidote protein